LMQTSIMLGAESATTFLTLMSRSP
jgi:hypothetical protein